MTTFSWRDSLFWGIARHADVGIAAKKVVLLCLSCCVVNVFQIVKMKKCNTLYSYFSKSPKTINTSPACADTPGKQKVNNTPKENARNSTGNTVNIGDLVWAKLDGYPWWPSLVCNHPTEKCHFKSKKIHVQFFDEPPSRAWVAEKFIKPFKGSDKGIKQNTDSKWQKAFVVAEKALDLSVQDRLALVVCNAESDNDSKSDHSDDCHSTDAVNSDMALLKQNAVSGSKRKESGPNSEKVKRRRILIASDSDESEDEFKPRKSDESDSESVSSGVEELSISEPECVEESPMKKPKLIHTKKRSAKVAKKQTTISPTNGRASEVDLKPTAKVNDQTKARLSLFASADQMGNSFVTLNLSDGKVWNHLSYDFLKPENIRDMNKRPPSHPEYDSRTLHVPDSFKKTLTPALRQWWEMKSKHFDTILFFKVGKFYELYHMDAVIGVNELNLVYMKGDFAHSGFPEIAYGRYSASLIERGYCVARVEQTETPQMMEERCRKLPKPTKFDKVVNREICQITSKGTRRYGYLDAQSNDANAAYLLSVTEKSFESSSGCESEYGVCFIDTSIGKFYLGQFQDDRHGSRFQTLIAHYIPVQVLYEKGTLSSKTLQILKNCLNSALLDPLLPNTQFWDSNKTLQFLAEGKYFETEVESARITWPAVLKGMLDESDVLGLTAKDDWNMAIGALGACTWYLAGCYIEQELLTMKNFEVYVPIDVCPSLVNKQSTWDHVRSRRYMNLDGCTLKNLDVFQNSCTGTLEGTLLSKLDHCNTLAGKRLLRRWLCAPLCNVESINDRLDAISDLINNDDVASKSSELLKKLPDLERLLSKIHTQGSSLRSKTHPDSRAIFYDDVIYSKRKIMDFLAALNGFKTAVEIIQLFKNVRMHFKSKLLKQCVTLSGDEDGDPSMGKFPDLHLPLAFFDNAFDQEKAKKDGKIIPAKGVDAEYDEAVREIKNTSQKLDEYLKVQCGHFGCKVTYVGSARNRYQLEVPDRFVKHASSKYEFQSQRKGFKRYWTPEIKEMLNTVLNAEDRRDAALRDIMRRIFYAFSKEYDNWDHAVHCLATLDVLIGLCHYSKCGGNVMCRPSILLPDNDSKPFLEIRNGYHPCITNVFAGGEFIPNDTVIGTSDAANSDVRSSSANIVLVTGPNMGGKSTLMRQVGLIIIIAQMGCYVPAEECRLTPVDRIFTRLGASDRIMSGESTFYVELSETASILHHATQHSLVLMDELGRGTSTYDGMAIAYAVVKQLAQVIHCRTLFSTHYHALVDSFSTNPNCKLGHMACLVENENEDDPSQETITFLYKFVGGACPKSYGFNAAKLAGMPEDVVRLGHRKSKELETSVVNCRTFRAFYTRLSKEHLLRLISKAKM